MSTVIGIAHGDHIYMVADTAFNDEVFQREGAASKLYTVPVEMRTTTTIGAAEYEKESVAVGICGDLRVINLLSVKLNWPPFSCIHHGNVEEYLIQGLTMELKDFLKQSGALSEQDGFATFHGTMLIGIQGRLFIMFGDFSVLECKDGYAAIGSGSAFASGALHALPSTMSIGERLALALRATQHFDKYTNSRAVFKSDDHQAYLCEWPSFTKALLS